MANDCLVTKLKSVVSNDALPVLGALKFRVGNSGGNKVSIARITKSSSVAGDFIISISNGTLYNSDGTVSYGNSYNNWNGAQVAYMYASTGDAYITVNPKKDITIFQFDKYKSVTGGIDYTDYVAHDMVINLSDFLSVLGLRILKLDMCDVVGNLLDLQNCTNIAQLYLSLGNVQGDLKDLVAAWINNGTSLTSINLSISPRDGLFDSKMYPGKFDIRFNGKELPKRTMKSGSTFAWESASKMYIKNNQANTFIYTLGYSDQEIATKTASGGEWAGFTVTKFD